ncbi:MAG: biotin transporter BioY [candidate division KSB1 bacterium]|nr:biotin transporter BioY [candidate division KSB1 bacterium]MDZ7340499.1 biotin transporter BioY [candidate division KSB1 bacterium]
MSVTTHNRKIILVSLFAALTAVGAFIKIPLPHIPITLQTLVVIMSGNLLGYKLGTLSQLLYLVVGLLGVPIFAYGGGPGYIFQPSFGYLLGYPVGAFLIGLLVHQLCPPTKMTKISSPRCFMLIFCADVVGVVVLFFIGLVYLYFTLKYGWHLRLEQMTTAGLNWEMALKTAIFVFLPVDLIKILLATWLTLMLRRWKGFANFWLG